MTSKEQPNYTRFVPAKAADDDAVTEQVLVISTDGGWYTVDSGNKYKSYGKGTKWLISIKDRPSLERMGLIAHKET